MAYDCLIYGLGLHSNRAVAGLTGLPPAPRVDVTVHFGQLPDDALQATGQDVDEFHTGEVLDDAGEPNLRVARLFGGRYLRIGYGDGTVFVISGDHRTVWVDWPAPFTVEDAATYLLGPVLGYLLRLRGHTCLHASAVAIGEHAVVLVGPSGAGKSTTAAALAQLGCPVLSDDIAVLREEASGFMVEPAYPRLRLWPETVQGLFGSPDALPRIIPGWEKRFLDLTGERFVFQRTALPLAAVYFLGERVPLATVPAIGNISPQAALMALVSDTYGTLVLDSALRARELQVLGELVRRVPIREVRGQDDLSGVAGMAAAILADFAAVSLPTS